MANITGDNFNNVLNGTVFSDVILALGGNDVVTADDGADLAFPV